MPGPASTADAGGPVRCNIEELNRDQRRVLDNRGGRYVTPLDLAAECSA